MWARSDTPPAVMMMVLWSKPRRSPSTLTPLRIRFVLAPPIQAPRVDGLLQHVPGHGSGLALADAASHDQCGLRVHVAPPARQSKSKCDDDDCTDSPPNRVSPATLASHLASMYYALVRSSLHLTSGRFLAAAVFAWASASALAGEASLLDCRSWQAMPDWLGNPAGRAEVTSGAGLRFSVGQSGRGMKRRCPVDPAISTAAKRHLTLRYRAEGLTASSNYFLYLPGRTPAEPPPEQHRGINDQAR